jgi:hypothetical protein
MDGSSGVPGMHKEKSVVWDGHDLKSESVVLCYGAGGVEERSEYRQTAVFVC